MEHWLFSIKIMNQKACPIKMLCCEASQWICVSFTHSPSHSLTNVFLVCILYLSNYRLWNLLCEQKNWWSLIHFNPLKDRCTIFNFFSPFFYWEAYIAVRHRNSSPVFLCFYGQFVLVSLVTKLHGTYCMSRK